MIKPTQHGNTSVRIINREKPKLLVEPINLIFYIIFFLAFTLSGLLTMIDLFPYRMGVASLLVFPLFLLYGVRIDSVFILYTLLTIVVGFSAWYNQSPITSTFLFLRILVFSYLIYYLVKLFARPDTIKRVIQLCVLIGLIQLPVLIFQLLTYDWLPAIITTGMNLSRLDYTFGTFNFKGDYSMTFFLTALVIFLLFDKKRNHIIAYRIPVILWFTFTVMLADSDIVKGIMLLVWGVYLITHLNRKIGVYLFLIIILLFSAILATGLWEKTGASIGEKIVGETEQLINGNGVDVYLSGGYARGAALNYFFTNDISLLGDGPSKYVDPITKRRIRGNVGHLFAFYSELGLLGWLLSMLIFFQIAFKYNRGKIRLSWVATISFVTITILSFTSHIMNDISLVLTYCLINKIDLIKPILGKKVSAGTTGIRQIQSINIQ